jgi:hypothetical protein
MQCSEEANVKTSADGTGDGDEGEDGDEKRMWMELVVTSWDIWSESVACSNMKGGASGNDGIVSVLLTHGSRLTGGGAGGKIEISNTFGKLG